MKTTEIQDLISFIAQSGLEEVHIETEAIKLHVKKSLFLQAALPTSSVPTAVAMPPVSDNPDENKKDQHSQYITITSPMVGTFYRSPHPQAAPFIQVGDMITQGTKLCIIEAMKLFNEIESEVQGKIIQILVEDVSPVAYDQPLFVVDPC